MVLFLFWFINLIDGYGDYCGVVYYFYFYKDGIIGCVNRSI